MTSPARVAADVAAVLPLDDPLGQLARRRLADAAREQESYMPIDSRDVLPVHSNRTGIFETLDEQRVEQVGAPLRDAAVDPQPGDFLPPTNAGAADPHGPAVLAIEVGSLEYQRRVAERRAAELPDAAAGVEEWRTYAIGRGADRHWAEAQTVPQLREVFGR
ncbi:hypothetical protein DQ244_01620 [Blastococcus sp. TBT05-19]|uniref:hypothetical protein n=1 Tax=Blastococcus sp. TBT05-19 TaxID=2250581 RepID=UPI000DE80084|nr:hypothetical protein [Blastococcus sp. TBT05-19]RBY94086.1 hypothetical protein DQ244_01620 [Blastococcus sp. TBT05-19]